MGKKSIVAVLVVAIVVCLCVAFVFYIQFSNLQAEKDELTLQNIALQTQNNTLQKQITELQLQNRERQDRLSDLTYQLALERHLRVEITDAYCNRGWSPLGGLTVSHPANITILNSDAVPLFGLTATFRFINRDSGVLIGQEGVSKVDRVDVGERRVIMGYAYTVVGPGIDDNTVCKITLSKSDRILDEWLQELS
jgi:hypothetical protein